MRVPQYQIFIYHLWMLVLDAELQHSLFLPRLKDVYSFLFFILSNKAFIGMPLIILNSKFEAHWMTPLL